MIDKTNEIAALIDKSAKAHSAPDALHFSQAACNVANALCSAVSAEQVGLQKGPQTTGLTRDQIEHMAQRFLGWRLPDTFAPDAGISFERVCNPGSEYEHRNEPVGTNLFTATEAEAMVRHMAEGMPS